MSERLLTAREVGELVGLSTESVLRRYRAGAIPGFRLGSNVLRFAPSEIAAWLESCRRATTPVLGSSSVGSLADQFPELREFFGGYFHQDWDIDARDDDGVIRLYLREASPEDVAAVRRQLHGLLELGLSEAELADRLYSDLGSYYLPTDGIADWLRSVRERLG